MAINLNRYGKIVSPTSDREFTRRRETVQKKMQEEGVDCILLYGSYIRQGGAIRYFVDYPTGGTNALFAILPQEGGIALFGHGHKNSTTIPPAVTHGADVNFGYPYAVVAGFTMHHIFDEVVRYVKAHGFKRIGLYRTGLLPYDFVKCVLDNVDGGEPVKVDDLLDEIMAVKSEEELEYCRYTCHVHDVLYAALPAIVRPGKREKDLANEIQKLATDMDCEGLNIMIGAGNPMAHHQHYFFQNKVIQENDYIDLLVEVSCAGGYYGELSRMWSLGEPDQEMIDLDNGSIEIQAILADAARPGVPASKLMEILHTYQREHGYKLEDRFFGHSQGLDLTQRPLYAYDDMLALGNEKAIIKKRIPWNTLIMLSGMGMLLGLGSSLGVNDYLGELAQNIPTAVVVPFFALLAGAMSLFSSSLSVVYPTLLPIAGALAMSSGINPVAVMAGIIIGSATTAMSPLSTAGAMLMANCSEDICESSVMFNKMFEMVVFAMVLLACCAAIGMFSLWGVFTV